LIFLWVQNAIPFRVVANVPLYLFAKVSVFQTRLEALLKTPAPRSSELHPRFDFGVGYIVIVPGLGGFLAGEMRQSRRQCVPEWSRHAIHKGRVWAGIHRHSF
jgi:hypothetical protein